MTVSRFAVVGGGKTESHPLSKTFPATLSASVLPIQPKAVHFRNSRRPLFALLFRLPMQRR